MARAGTARYDIEAEDKFSRVLEKAGGGFTSLQAKVVTANAAMQLGSVAAAGFAGALDGLYNESAKVVDRQAKVAAAIGVTTEYLEAAQYSAELNGVAAADMERAYAAMSKGVNDAAQGAGTFKAALDKMGLDAQALKLKSTEEQYASITKGLSELSTTAEKVAFSEAFFGEKGAYIIRNTGEQIAAARAELDQFGISLSRVDSAKVEAANDSLFKLGTVAAGAKREMAVGLAPAIETVAEKILGAARGTVAFDVAAQKVGMLVVTSAGYMANAYQLVDGSIKTVVQSYLMWERAFYQVKEKFTLGEKAEEAAFQVQVITAQIDKLQAKIEKAFKFEAKSDMLAAYRQNIADATQAAESLDKKLAALGGGGASGAAGAAGDPAKERERDRVNAQAQALQEQLASEEDRIKISMDKRLALIDKFEALNTDKKRQADILRSEVENEAIQKRRELRAKEEEQIAKERGQRDEKIAGLESKIAQMQGGFEAEKALLIEQSEERLEIIAEYAELASISKADADQLYIDSEKRKIRELTELREKEAANAAAIEKKKQDSVLGYLEKGLGAAAGKSRSAFELQKAVDITRAVIAGKVAAVEAFKWGNAKAGLAGGIAASAASLAATGSIIQSIGGQSFGGGTASAGSSGEAPSVTGGGDFNAVVNSGGDANVQFSFNIINPLGGIVDNDAFDELVMDSVEREIDAKGLTGKVDVNEIRLQVNRERARAA